MREAHDDVFEDSRVFVDAPTAVHESGDLIDPIANGRFDAGDIRADLAALCRANTRAVRTTPRSPYSRRSAPHSRIWPVRLLSIKAIAAHVKTEYVRK